MNTNKNFYEQLLDNYDSIQSNRFYSYNDQQYTRDEVKTLLRDCAKKSAEVTLTEVLAIDGFLRQNTKVLLTVKDRIRFTNHIKNLLNELHGFTFEVETEDVELDKLLKKIFKKIKEEK